MRPALLEKTMATSEDIKKFIDEMYSKIRYVHDHYVGKYPEHMAYLCLTQMALESGYGTARLMMDNFAPFGVKATNIDITLGDYYEARTSEYVNGKYISTVARFRKYASFIDAIDAWYQLMGNKRYQPVRESTCLADAFVKVKECGYATSPDYPTTLKKVFSTISKYLSNTPLTNSNYTHQVITQNDPLNVREFPDLNARIIGSIPKGEKIYVNHEWSYVPKYNGFVYNKYIKEV